MQPKFMTVSGLIVVVAGTLQQGKDGAHWHERAGILSGVKDGAAGARLHGMPGSLEKSAVGGFELIDDPGRGVARRRHVPRENGVDLEYILLDAPDGAVGRRGRDNRFVVRRRRPVAETESSIEGGAHRRVSESFVDVLRAGPW